MRTLAFALVATLAVFGPSLALAQPHDHGGRGAHSASAQTTPADGEMGAPPAAFSATFEHPMRLTALVITPQGGDPTAVAVPRSAPATTVSVPLPRLAPGVYAFTWTATGADNHTMTGRVRYMVH
jgi:methionine-rich copper-binding protein CopC